MSAQAPLLVRMRPRWLQLRNQQALLLPCRSVGHISILSRTFNHIESTFRDPGSNVGIVAPTWASHWSVLTDCTFERPVTATIAAIANARGANLGRPTPAKVKARHAARSRLTISRTVFLLSPSRWLISRYD